MIIFYASIILFDIDWIYTILYNALDPQSLVLNLFVAVLIKINFGVVNVFFFLNTWPFRAKYILSH